MLRVEAKRRRSAVAAYHSRCKALEAAAVFSFSTCTSDNYNTGELY